MHSPLHSESKIKTENTIHKFGGSEGVFVVYECTYIDNRSLIKDIKTMAGQCKKVRSAQISPA